MFGPEQQARLAGLRANTPSKFGGFAFAGPALLWTLLFFLAPFLVMLVVSLTTKGDSGASAEAGPSGGAGWTLDNYSQAFERGHYLEALTNSLEVTAIVTVISVLLAYPLAFILVEKVPRRWQRVALVAAVLPFWTSYVVRSYAWVLVLSNNGIINRTLLDLGLIAEPLALANSRAATIIGFVHFFTMLLTLTIYASLAQLPKSYARAAADLGAGPVSIFLHVILPLTFPGVVTGAFLTFVLCIGDYITPQILGGNVELLMPQLIMRQIGRSADFPSASALSIVLMGVVTLVYLAASRWLKLERV